MGHPTDWAWVRILGTPQLQNLPGQLQPKGPYKVQLPSVSGPEQFVCLARVHLAHHPKGWPSLAQHHHSLLELALSSFYYSSLRPPSPLNLPPETKCRVAACR
jgi:hypothetical protein